MSAREPAGVGAALAGGIPNDRRDEDLDELLAGLHMQPKQVSSRYLYDERGSRLFREICRLPEYYPTRTETRILGSAAVEVAAAIGPGALLVELGSGAGEKTRMLLDELAKPAGYVPVDICLEQLLSSSRRLAVEYPHLAITPLCADFTRRLRLPARSRQANRILMFFPGSTIGNFTPVEARGLLARLAEVAGCGAGLLIGVDLVKPRAILEAAYDDSAGVTARFNLNVLRHLNRRFAGNFDEQLFRHAAPWVEQEARIEMQLWCQRDHFAEIAGTAVHFSEGEKLVTEWSHKYSLQSFADLARETGWKPQAAWSDPERLFSVHYLVAAGSDS